MQYKPLGSTGIEVSEFGFGGAPIGLANYLGRWDPDDAAQEAQAVRAIVTALEQGITYFDTALSYGAGRSERIFGKARREAGALAQRMRLATKTPGSKRSYAEVLESAEQSLANLGVDVIDVLQLHGSRWTDEEATQALEGGALDALRELQRQGKVRAIGFTAETGSPGAFRLLRSGAFDVLQIAYNIIYQDACNLMVTSGPIVEARQRGMGVVTMRSLSSGVFQKLLGLAVPGIEQQVDLHALALRFVLSNPYVDCPIVGMRTSGEVLHNVRLAADPARRLDLVELHRRYER